MSWFTMVKAKVLAKRDAEGEALRAKTKVELAAEVVQAKADAAALEVSHQQQDDDDDRQDQPVPRRPV